MPSTRPVLTSVLAATIIGATGAGVAPSTGVVAVTPPAPLTAVVPARYAATAPGAATFDGTAAAGRLAAADTLAVTIAGRGAVPADAAAVVVNVTIVDPETDGTATVHPCATRPAVPLLSFSRNETTAISAAVPLDSTGDLCVSVDTAADVTLDVYGYAGPGSPVVALAPTRVFDSRATLPATGARTASLPRRLTAGRTVEFGVAGSNGLPSDAAAVLAAVTVSGAAGVGAVTLSRCGETDVVGSHRVRAAVTQAHAVFTALSPDGRLCVTSTVIADVTVDVTAAVPVGTPGLDAGPHGPVTIGPRGLVRHGGLSSPRVVEVDAGETIELPVAGVGGVPEAAEAAFVDVAVVDPDGPGSITVFPCDTTKPALAALHLPAAGVGRSSLLFAKLSDDGAICVFSDVAANLAVSVTGTAHPPAAPITDVPAATTLPTEPDDGAPSVTDPPVTDPPVTAAPETSQLPPPNPPNTAPPVADPSGTSPPGTAAPVTTATAGPGGCNLDETVTMNITGLVRLPNGLPPSDSNLGDADITSAHVTLRDHAIRPGGIVSEAGFNEAGFFLLALATAPVSPGCPKNYTIEAELTTAAGTVMYAELDVTGLFIAATPGDDIVEADITSTPIVLADITPTAPTAPAATTPAVSDPGTTVAALTEPPPTAGPTDTAPPPDQSP